MLLLIHVTSIAIIVRIVAGPLANVCQKRLTLHTADPLFITVVTYGSLSPGCLATGGLVGLTQTTTDFWGWMVACAVFAVLGNVLLIKAMHVGDLSVLGPINAYKAVVSMAIGILVLGEWPSRAGLLGTGLIVAGSFVVLRQPAGVPSAAKNQSAIRLRVLALLCAATDGVFLKKAIDLSNPFTAFVGWCVLGFLLSAGWWLLTQRVHWAEQRRVLLRQWTLYAGVVLAVGLMQVCTNLAFAGMQVGYALALFQTSALLSVLVGYQFFGEKNLLPKLIGAAIMVTGAALIVMMG